MRISPADAFEMRHLKRDDGNKVVPPSVALVAALESGYRFKLSSIEEAAASAKFPGFLTSDEFVALCEKNVNSSSDAGSMAKHISVLAPNGYITRATLQEAAAKAGTSEDALSNDEIDALFDALDDNNSGSISAEKLMEAMYGEEGKKALVKQRKEYARLKAEAEKEKIIKDAAATAASGNAAPAAAPAAGNAPNKEIPANKQQKKKTMCGC